MTKLQYLTIGMKIEQILIQSGMTDLQVAFTNNLRRAVGSDYPNLVDEALELADNQLPTREELIAFTSKRGEFMDVPTSKYQLAQRTMVKIATSDTIRKSVVQYSIDNATVLETLKHKDDKIAGRVLDLLTAAAIGTSPLHTNGEPSFLRTDTHFIIHGSFNDRGQKASIVIPIVSVEAMETTQGDYNKMAWELEAMAVKLADLLVVGAV